jgi:hypothetical protein
MNKNFVKGLIKYGLLVAMIAVTVNQTAKAQSLAYGLRVTIPFDFKVGDKSFTAGQYTVNRAQQDDSVIKISSWEGKVNALRPTVAVTIRKTRNRATLVFNRYGDQYYLAQVWPAGASTGRALPVSRSERDARNQRSDSVGQGAGQGVETVLIAADQP